MNGSYHNGGVTVRSGTKIYSASPIAVSGVHPYPAVLTINMTGSTEADANNQGTKTGISLTGNINGSWSPLEASNKNSGPYSSTDIVLYPDGVTDIVNGPYIDFGIGSAAYNNPYFTIGGVCGYMFTGGQNLAMGTASASKDVYIHAGGSLASDEKVRIKASGAVLIAPQQAAVSGGDSAYYLGLSSAAAFGIYYGSGAPSISAAQGSLYMRTDGSSTSTRMYINTTGSTTWTAVTTVA